MSGTLDRLLNGHIVHIEVLRGGNDWLSRITHLVAPLRDKRKPEDIPVKELRSNDHEDLLTEVKKYLEDCYDD